MEAIKWLWDGGKKPFLAWKEGFRDERYHATLLTHSNEIRTLKEKYEREIRDLREEKEAEKQRHKEKEEKLKRTVSVNTLKRLEDCEAEVRRRKGW